MSNRWDFLEVDGSEMRCYLALPEGPGPFPGVVVCMHAPGVDGFIRGIADRLAESGFAAIAPDLYHRQTEPEEDPLARMAKLRDDPVLRDLDAATGHLREQAEVRSERTGVVGFCMGGRLAYLDASHDRELRAAGHAFLNEARPSFRAEAATDAWARCLHWLRRHLA